MALRGWNTADMARAAGISHKTVGRFLRGEVQTPKTAAKLAKALDQDVRRYLTRVEVAGRTAGVDQSILPFEAAVTR